MDRIAPQKLGWAGHIPGRVDESWTEKEAEFGTILKTPKDCVLQYEKYR